MTADRSYLPEPYVCRELRVSGSLEAGDMKSGRKRPPYKVRASIGKARLIHIATPSPILSVVHLARKSRSLQ